MTISFYKKYCKKYALILLIGVLAAMSVDAVQLFIPEFLGELVEEVSSNPKLIVDDIKNVIVDILIISIILFLGRILWRFCQDRFYRTFMRSPPKVMKSPTLSHR